MSTTVPERGQPGHLLVEGGGFQVDLESGPCADAVVHQEDDTTPGRADAVGRRRGDLEAPECERAGRLFVDTMLSTMTRSALGRERAW